MRLIMHDDDKSCLAPGQLRSVAPTRSAASATAAIPGRGGLLQGERPVGGSQPEREGQRLELGPQPVGVGVDVEQPHRLQQLAGPGRGPRPAPRRPAPGSAPPAPGRAAPAGSWTASAPRPALGAGKASRSSSIAQLRAGRPRAWITRGCSSPAVPDRTVPASSSSAHRPGCQGARSACRTASSTRAARAITRADSIASAQPAGRPGTPPAGRLQLTGQHGRGVPRLGRHARLDGGQLLIARPPVHPGPGPAAGHCSPAGTPGPARTAPGPGCPGRRCAPGWLSRPGQQRGTQLRARRRRSDWPAAAPAGAGRRRPGRTRHARTG